MLDLVIAFVVGGGVGFAFGRVKNSTKLASIQAYLEKAEATAVTDVKTLIADIKKKL